MRLGLSLLDRSHIDAMQNLIEGELLPSELPALETALRAFLTSSELGILKVNELILNEHMRTWETSEDDTLYIPFSDHLLDYEFIAPGESVELSMIPAGEISFLHRHIGDSILAAAEDLIRSRASTAAGAASIVDDWYVGVLSKRDYDKYPAEPYNLPEYRSMSIEDFLEERWHPIFHDGPVLDAMHIVQNYRSGIGVYSAKPIIAFCREHIFWKWPDKIFENFDREYYALVDELRGPANSIFSIPPVTLMVLSRAATRNDIPQAIVDIREEYSIDRVNLWNHLSEMWSAHTLRKKAKLLDDLEKAAEALFVASFPKTEGAFSFAVDIAENVAFGGLSGLKRAGDHFSPRIALSGVSLANRLSADFSRYLVDDRELLRRHLTNAELRNFGAL